MEYRTEEDSLGQVKVSKDKYWGAQTERSLHNFAIGHKVMPIEVIRAYGYIKKAAALVNTVEGNLPKEKCKLIISACDEILDGKLDDQFPLKIFRHSAYPG